MWPSSIGRILRPAGPHSCETFLSRGSRVVTPAVRPESWQAGAPPPTHCGHPSCVCARSSVTRRHRQRPFVSASRDLCRRESSPSLHQSSRLYISAAKFVSCEAVGDSHERHASSTSVERLLAHAEPADTPRRLFRRLPPGAARQQSLRSSDLCVASCASPGRSARPRRRPQIHSLSPYRCGGLWGLGQVWVKTTILERPVLQRRPERTSSRRQPGREADGYFRAVYQGLTAESSAR